MEGMRNRRSEVRATDRSLITTHTLENKEREGWCNLVSFQIAQRLVLFISHEMNRQRTEVKTDWS